MTIRSLLGLILTGLLVVATLPGTFPQARAQTEVDRAAGAAARAEAEMAAARRDMDAWATRRGTAEARLLAGTFSFELANRRLEQAAFELLDLRNRILDGEARIRDLREITEARAVEAYMNGAGSEILSIWSASDFARGAMLEETVAALRRTDTRVLAELSVERERLRALQDTYGTRLLLLEDLRVAAQRDREALEELFMTVDARYAVAARNLRAADERFHDALTEWEAAQRRRAARSVELWRPLLEEYFAEDLVEEALAVMQCESRGNPDAVHPESGATGLFQFLAGTWAFSSIKAGFAGASRFDAEANIAAAAWLVDYSVRTGHPRGAWGHWVCQP